MIYVGIDVSSKKHDVTIMNDQGVILNKTFTIKNNINEFKKLHNSIQDAMKSDNDLNVRIGLEATGIYSHNLLNFLVNLNYAITHINPALTSMDHKAQTVHRQKTDRVDSKNICMFLYRNSLNFKPYSMPYIKLLN